MGSAGTAQPSDATEINHMSHINGKLVITVQSDSVNKSGKKFWRKEKIEGRGRYSTAVEKKYFITYFIVSGRITNF